MAWRSLPRFGSPFTQIVLSPRTGFRQVLTFYNIAEFYGDLLIAQGFHEEVAAVKSAYRQGGFKAAMAQVTDAYIAKLPVVLGTSVQEIKERLNPYVEAGVTRLIIPYVSSNDAVVEDGKQFLRSWESAH